SSRRRHTISKRDWSSDVCSSDLKELHGKRIHKRKKPCRRKGLHGSKTFKEKKFCREKGLHGKRIHKRKKLCRRKGLHGSKTPKEIGRASCREREENKRGDEKEEK